MTEGCGVNREAFTGLARYPEYKDSGIEWLGEIPAHWEVRRAKEGYREIDRRSKVGSEMLLGLTKNRGVVPRSEIAQRASVARSYTGYKRCAVGDLVVNKLQAWNGVLGVSRHEGIVSPDYTVMRTIDRGWSTEYNAYLFRTPMYVSAFASRSKGIGLGFMRLYSRDFGLVETIIPPLPEQRAIVRHLDRETATIDALVAKQQELIRLLQEKRTALISHAVTKGLDPDAAMKDAGVEWLGEIPAHWEVRRAKEGYREIDRRSKVGSEMLLGLTKNRGVVPRSEIAQRASVARSYTGYKRCGDLE